MKERLHIWTSRDVRLAVPAVALSVLGDAMAMVALTLRVHASGAGPYAVAGLLLCFALPVVLTMGLAGSVADRVDPRLVLGAAGSAQVFASLALARWDGLAATLLLVVVLQTGFAFSQPVWQSVLSRAVGDDGIGRLVSLQHGLAAVAAPVGAGLGGVLVELRGDHVVFLLDGATYLVLAAVGVTLRARPVPQAGGASGGFLPRQGWRAVRADRLVWILLAALLPYVVALESMNAVEVFLVRDALGGSESQFGLTQVVTGAGAVMGALAAGRFAADGHRVRAVIASLTVIAVAMVGMGLSPGLAWFYVASLVTGTANAVVNAAFFALLVRRTPAAGRGAVLAFVNGVARSASLVALALGGLAGATLGPRTAYVLAGVLGLVVTAWAVRAMRGVSTAPLEANQPGPVPAAAA